MKHVAVLMGGWSAEREVSLCSGKACADALERMGYQVSRIDVDREIAGKLGGPIKPDVALNVLHGRPGEDGTLQGMLEIFWHPLHSLGRPRLRSRMQKYIAKTVLKLAQVPVPGGLIATRADAAKRLPPPGLMSSNLWRKARASACSSYVEDHKHPPAGIDASRLGIRRARIGRALYCR